MTTAVRSVLLSGCSAGVGLWFAQAALDIVASPHGPVRVAFLPPWSWLGVCVVAGVVGVGVVAVALTRVTAPPGAAASRDAALISTGVADAVLPLHALWILALPYLPIVPDAVPVLRVAAGPALWAIAGVILLQVTLAAWALGRRRERQPAAPAGPSRLAVAAVFGVSLAVTTLAAGRLAGTSLFPSGDEPHYLVISQSLWRDGDLRIEDNHARGDYREYFGRDLAPHYVTRGTDQQIYSIHPIGVSVLMAPVYAAGGYRATVAVQMLMAALAISVAWWWAVRQTGSSGAATWAWAAIALGAPWLVNAFTIYPEVGGALLAMVAFVAATTWPSRTTRLAPWVIAGVCVALLPWFSTKYVPMSGALLVVALGRAWLDDERVETSPLRASLALVVPYAASLAGWFMFFHAIWGTFSPSAPYGSDNQTNPIFLRTGGPGLLFDQEYGLLPLMPAAILAFSGFVAMWRSGGGLRRQAVEVVMVSGALFATVGAFRIWWGGSAGPSRPLIAGLAFLLLPMSVAFMRAGGHLQRAGHRLLVLAGIAIAATLVFAQRGLLLAAGRDGSSSLLQWWSPSWHLTDVAPSFIAHRPQEAIPFVAVWIVVALVVGWWFARAAAEATGRGRAALVATTTTLAAVAAITIVIDATLASAEPGAVAAEQRSRSPLLDHFDATRRPVAVRYDPLEIVEAAYTLRWVVLGARSVQPRTGLGVPIALNARVSLPAGRYLARVHALPNLAAPVSGTLGIQVGRVGDALETWNVTLSSGRAWTQEFSLAVDANFVGIRASHDIASALKEVWFEPIAIVDAHARVPVAEVLAARRSGQLTAYFHDEQVWLEPGGFWTRGTDVAAFTVATAAPGRVIVRVSVGPIANHLRVDVDGRTVEFDMEANSVREVPVDVAARPIRLAVHARDGFVPAERDPSSRDQRALGAWIELRQEPSTKEPR